MNPLARALLDDIIARPDDDTPRLVYADWLSENGQEERAEFIRVQVASGEPAAIAGDVWMSPTEGRVYELLRAECQRWTLCPLTDGEWTWNRGFIESVRLPLRLWISGGPTIASLHPVETVGMTYQDIVIDGRGKVSVLFLPGDLPRTSRDALYSCIEGCVIAERHRRDDFLAVRSDRAGAVADADARGISAGLITWARTEARLRRGSIVMSGGKPVGIIA